MEIDEKEFEELFLEALEIILWHQSPFKENRNE